MIKKAAIMETKIGIFPELSNLLHVKSIIGGDLIHAFIPLVYAVMHLRWLLWIQSLFFHQNHLEQSGISTNLTTYCTRLIVKCTICIIKRT